MKKRGNTRLVIVGCLIALMLIPSVSAASKTQEKNNGTDRYVDPTLCLPRSSLPVLQHACLMTDDS